MKKNDFRKDKLYPKKISKDELKELRNQLPKRENSKKYLKNTNKKKYGLIII